jgi:VanZ family protein
MLTRLRNLVAYLGTNVQFLADVGHFTVPYALVATFPRAKWEILGLFVAYAAVKEYYFDARYEVPHQTFWDNTEDFIGYLLGAAVGCAVFK